MFSRLSVSRSVHSGGVCPSACWDTEADPSDQRKTIPPEQRQTPPSPRADTPSPNLRSACEEKRAECILVSFCIWPVWHQDKILVSNPELFVSSGSRISQMGASSLKGVRKPIIFKFFPRKLHETDNKWTEREPHIPISLLDPPMVIISFCCHSHFHYHLIRKVRTLKLCSWCYGSLHYFALEQKVHVIASKNWYDEIGTSPCMINIFFKHRYTCN